MGDKNEIIKAWDDSIGQLELFGSQDEYLKLIEDTFEVSVSVRDNAIKIVGDPDDAANASTTIDALRKVIKAGRTPDKQTVEYLCIRVASGEYRENDENYDDVVYYTMRGRAVRSKTLGQKRYIKAVADNDVVFAIGPAGTGKTYLAIAMAVTALKNNEVNRIVLTRPAIEAGEKLGFLPGDLKDKVDPYLRPLYDALYEIMGIESYERQYARGAIEIAPLAYMRGRTLDSAFIILDEAQNTTPEQMKMFLTRLGYGSKAIVTGDVTQIDLPDGKKSGLNIIGKILKNIKGIAFIYLDKSDVVRNSLVQKIIDAYERYEGNTKSE